MGIVAGRDNYNDTLKLVDKLCGALDVPPADLLELIDDPARPKAKPKRTAEK